MNRETAYYPSLHEMSRAAARFVSNLAYEIVEGRGIFTLVLSGGSTPCGLYELLAGPEFGHTMPWNRIHLFWGDERCVPRDSSESNYQMAFKTMISKVDIPEGNVHPMPVEIQPPQAAAGSYADMLKDFFVLVESRAMNRSARGPSVTIPSFDLILLGMGGDGHTASLFPGERALNEDTLWVAAVEKPAGSPPVPRITLTLPVINEAENVLFLVSGREKLAVLQNILESPSQAAARYPAARVNPRRGRLFLFHDYDTLR